ncbi:MAG: YigZ family protein [Oscillospiraceae bacterium]|nr:YigZ family protein [Oscillospiraceae bacterium]
MSYLTLEKNADAEYIVNKSRFISHASPVKSAEEANEYISSIRSKYPDASHNVFAFIVRSPEYSRYSDDGEPSGTSGKPVLDVIKNNLLTDSIIVVTRYFGGVLLGTGGLVRAYSHSASLAVEAAGIVKMSLCSEMNFTCSYSMYERLSKLVPQYCGVISDTSFTDNVTVFFRIPSEREEEIAKAIVEQSNGAFKTVKTGENFGKFSV